jgi:hypothetical protein
VFPLASSKLYIALQAMWKCDERKSATADRDTKNAILLGLRSKWYHIPMLNGTN